LSYTSVQRVRVYRSALTAIACTQDEQNFNFYLQGVQATNSDAVMDYAYLTPSSVMDTTIVKTTLMRLDVVSVFFFFLPLPHYYSSSSWHVFTGKINVCACRSLSGKRGTD